MTNINSVAGTGWSDNKTLWLNKELLMPRKNRDRETPEFCIMVRVLDPEMMTALRTKAVREKVSVAEVVRTYITWGQEADKC